MILLFSDPLSSVRLSYLLIFVIRENEIFISVIHDPLFKYQSDFVLAMEA